MTAKKRLIRNLIIAALAIAVLGGGYYFALKWEPDTKKDEPAETAPTTEATYIVSEETDSVEKLHIKNSASEYDIVKTKGEDDGYVYSIPALTSGDENSASIGSAFSSLIKMTATKTMNTGVDKAESYGLTAPSASYVIYKSDGSSITVLIGDEVPTGGEFYCMVEGGDKIYTIGSYKADTVNKTPDDYRNTSLMSISKAEDITGFTLWHGTEKVMSIRTATEDENAQKALGTMWAMDYPWNEEVSDEKLSGLFEKLLKIEATGFAAQGDSPQFDYRFEITAADENYSFSVGGAAPNGGVYLRNDASSMVYIADESIRAAIENVNPNDYTGKLVKIASIDKVSRAVVRRGDTEYVMEPGDENGKAYVINGAEVAEDSFKKNYQTVIGVLFRERGSFEVSGEPYMTITYEFKDGGSDTTKYYEYDERDFVAVRSDGSTVKVLKSTIAEVEKLMQ